MNSFILVFTGKNNIFLHPKGVLQEYDWRALIIFFLWKPFAFWEKSRHTATPEGKNDSTPCLERWEDTFILERWEDTSSNLERREHTLPCKEWHALPWKDGKILCPGKMETYFTLERWKHTFNLERWEHTFNLKRWKPTSFTLERWEDTFTLGRWEHTFTLGRWEHTLLWKDGNILYLGKMGTYF